MLIRDAVQMAIRSTMQRQSATASRWRALRFFIKTMYRECPVPRDGKRARSRACAQGCQRCGTGPSSRMLSGVGTVADTWHKRALIRSHAPTLDDSIRGHGQRCFGGRQPTVIRHHQGMQPRNDKGVSNYYAANPSQFWSCETDLKISCKPHECWIWTIFRNCCTPFCTPSLRSS